MDTFRDLIIKVGAQHTQEFVAAVDAALTSGWTRARDAEQRAKQISSDFEQFYYLCGKRGGREAAMLALHRQDAATMHVANIVPVEAGQLTPQQYNDVLKDFHDEILSKIRVPFEVEMRLGSDQLRLENLMSADAFDKLQQFSGMANKSTGSSHPMDCERWYAFLVGAYRTKHRLDPSTLMRWLVESQNWPPEVAQDLASEFEFAMGLLAYNES